MRNQKMYNYEIEVKRWIDGDTVSAIVDLGFYVAINARFRIMNIDTPERGEPKFLEAKAAASGLYPPGTKLIVTVKKVGGYDKYGRWLIELPVLAKLLEEQNLLKKVVDI